MNNCILIKMSDRTLYLQGDEILNTSINRPLKARSTELLLIRLSLSRVDRTPPFSAPEKMEMILLRLRSSGTEGRGLELWLAASASFPPPPKMVLLILTGGAGGLSSRSPSSHMIRGEQRQRKRGGVGGGERLQVEIKKRRS